MIDSDPVLHQLKDHEFHRELKKIVDQHMTTRRFLELIAQLDRLDDDEDYRGDIKLQCEEALKLVDEVIVDNQELDIHDTMVDLKQCIREIKELLT